VRDSSAEMFCAGKNKVLNLEFRWDGTGQEIFYTVLQDLHNLLCPCCLQNIKTLLLVQASPLKLHHQILVLRGFAFMKNRNLRMGLSIITINIYRPRTT
jgi:hypothetical protein